MTTTSVTVEWSRPALGDLDNYWLSIWLGNNAMKSQSLPNTINNFSFPNLDPGTAYELKIISVSGGGLSAEVTTSVATST